MSVTLQEVMSAAQRRAASLAAEVAGYLVLAIADQVAGAPRRMGFADVMLNDDGAVRLGSAAPASDVDAEHALRDTLAELLVLASSVTPALLRTGQRPAVGSVDALVREL